VARTSTLEPLVGRVLAVWRADDRAGDARRLRIAACFDDGRSAVLEPIDPDDRSWCAALTVGSRVTLGHGNDEGWATGEATVASWMVAHRSLTIVKATSLVREQRRATVRARTKLPIHIQWARQGAPFMMSGLTQDLSGGGLAAFVIERDVPRPPPGTDVVVRLDIGDHHLILVATLILEPNYEHADLQLEFTQILDGDRSRIVRHVQRVLTRRIRV